MVHLLHGRTSILCSNPFARNPHMEWDRWIYPCLPKCLAGLVAVPAGTFDDFCRKLNTSSHFKLALGCHLWMSSSRKIA